METAKLWRKGHEIGEVYYMGQTDLYYKNKANILVTLACYHPPVIDAMIELGWDICVYDLDISFGRVSVVATNIGVPSTVSLGNIAFWVARVLSQISDKNYRKWELEHVRSQEEWRELNW